MKTMGRLRLGTLVALFAAMLSCTALAASPCDRPGTPLEAKALAERAAAHLADVGLDRAFNDFMSPDGGFMPHDLYVFVFDRGGRIWVNGRFPGRIGANIAGARDRKGRPFLFDAMRRADQDGSAWVEYSWFNPCTGTPMAKSTHVVRAGEFFVAVGAYGTLEA